MSVNVERNILHVLDIHTEEGQVNERQRDDGAAMTRRRVIVECERVTSSSSLSMTHDHLSLSCDIDHLM